MSFGNPFAVSQNGNVVQGLGHSGFEVSLNYVAGLPDPNIVANSSIKLWFKSLLKRDETTKEKALAEFVQYASLPQNVKELKDDLVLITWVQLYPKLSISESKTVRSLAHQLQTQLISSLQKSYVKYLKDTIPVLLSGTYDLDTSVCNSTVKNISRAFNDDQTKINNLWIIFQNEILNFADQALNKETVDTISDDRFVPHDEAELKYLRLINATISMVSHMIQVGCKLHPDKIDKSIDSYHTFFTYENLWHYLLINSNSNNQRIYKALLQLINTVVHLNPDLFTEKSWKLMSKRLIKSLTFVKKVDVKSTSSMMYSSMIVPILSTLNILNQKNPDFFQYDKSYKERIFGFLKIGSLNSDPSYYTKLSQFITTATTVFSTDDDIITLETILHEDFTNEISKNSKLRTGIPFIVNSLTTYLEVITHFDKAEMSSNIIDEIMAIPSGPLATQIIEPLSKLMPSSIISDFLKQWSTKDSGNITILLSVALKTSISLQSSLENSFEDLRLRSDDDEEGKTFINHPAFTMFDFVIKQNLTDYSKQVEEFLDELPSFITPLIIEPPIEILKNYSKSKFYNSDLFVEIFDSFVIKLDFIGQKKTILSKLNTFDHKDELLSKSEELQTALSEQTTIYDFENDELFKSHLISKDSAISLWDLAKEKTKQSQFTEYFLQNNASNQELCFDIIFETDLLDEMLFKSPKLHIVVSGFLDTPEILNKYVQLLKKQVEAYGASTDLINQVSSTIKSYPFLISRLISNDLLSLFESKYGSFVDSRLSIGNPLETNIYLLPTKDDCFAFTDIIGTIRYAVFLHEIGIEIPDELLVYLGIISETIDDYVFLNEGSHPSLPSSIVNFQSSIKSKLMDKFSNYTYKQLVQSLISNTAEAPLALLIPTSENNIITSFYTVRLLKHILSSLVDLESASTISELDIDKYTRTELRSKSKSSLLLFCTVISTLSPFLCDEKYDRVKNLVSSELIGLRPSEIIDSGVTKLTVLTNFMRDLGDGMPLQPQRFNMIVQDINKWLDSDVAYEPEFTIVRIQLLNLFVLWNVAKFDKTDSFKDLCARVLQDATGLVSLDDGDHLLELKYWSLKLFLVLQKNDSLDKEVVKEAETELLEGYVNDQTVNVNMPILIYNELLNRFLHNVPNAKFAEHEDSLFEKFQMTKNFELKRQLLDILRKLILSKQQDLVVEFELSKDGDDLSQFKIPQKLIDLIATSPEFTDSVSIEEDEKLVNYLWCWMLVLFNFKDITLKLRTLYIQQLQNDNDELVTRFLNFISFIITDDDEKEFLSRIGDDHSVFINYTFDNDIGDISEEVRVLSMHVYYSVLVSIGSLASNWFNNIKDRGFKANIEQFTAKFISPSLISNKLLTFEERISSLTKENDNLTIKVNRVTNEIKSTYLIDEQHLEIVFKIPSSYPLANIEVSGPQRVGVKETQWKAWLLACQRIVTLQNGEISESLEFFLKNVSFHFKGFEECSICYSILHQDNSLPSKTCGTCKNKFHAGCLYKWFKSSGSNTCPLCRAPFNFK
ncbi:CYFA0S28e00496g1_1 [Cyberlindnera fabianii]|uniref:E3 ubiquitin-protein ligase listerin n=1 Tax=Cyberlindnera fabianii TaxID=36022 RepID=A0A061BAW1_CYBFA|nr:CYFA0S28e00496g1_1 [Cyberlindnera fabianii]